MPLLKKKNNNFLRTLIALSTAILLAWFLFAWFTRPLFKAPLSTAIFDSDGQLLGARIADDGQWRFGSSGMLPYKVTNAIVTFEDQRFYQHPGVDLKALAASILSQMGYGTKKRGGSTLTMQLMRMSLQNKNRNILSKTEEIAGALMLELTHTKKELLQQYLSNAPFGGNIVGIDAACWRYFGKDASDLSWAEASMLAVLPNQPSMIHISKNRSVLLEKRNKLLKNLYKKGFLDKTTLELSLEEDLPESPHPLPSLAPHLVDYITFDRKENGIINTTLDRSIQQMSIEVGQKYQTIHNEDQIEHLAILIIDNEKGKVLSYVGNAGNSPIDMIKARRSSGSILKPLLYMAAMDDNLITPWSLVSDIPIAINGYAPANFDRTFRGAVNADEALQRSLNIPFVLLLRSYGIGRFLERLKKAGLTSFRKDADHYGLSLVLGGGEVSLWEITNVYSSLAKTLSAYVDKEGRYPLPFYSAAMLSEHDHKRPNDEKNSIEPIVFTAGAIYNCTEALKGLGRPDEEGLWEEFSSSRPLAWKTGTSFGHRDAWAVGFDKKYTIGVWVGNADGKGRSQLTGMKRAAPVLFDVFNQLPHPRWFETPWDDLRAVSICPKSGYRATETCPVSESRYLPKNMQHSSACIYHQQYSISIESGKRLLEDCKSDKPSSTELFFVLPPAEASFYSMHHSDYKNPPGFDEGCIKEGFTNGKPQFSLIYPSENTRIFLPDDLSGKKQSVIFKAHHQDKSQKLFWHLNGKYLGETSEFHSMEIETAPGHYLLYLSDATGNGIYRKFEILER